MLAELDDRITLILSHMELQLTDVDGLDLYDRPDPKTFELYQDVEYMESDNRTTVMMEGGQGGIGLNTDTLTSPITIRQAAEVVDPEDPTTWGKVGRNAHCPCGSGKKFKHCHGSN